MKKIMLLALVLTFGCATRSITRRAIFKYNDGVETKVSLFCDGEWYVVFDNYVETKK